VNGAGDPLEPLVERLATAGVLGLRTMDFGPVRLRPAPGVVIRLTDGRTAADISTESRETVVLVDLAHDYATATRLAVAAPADAQPDAVHAAVGCLQAAGLSVTVLPDVPALVVARTVAMLAAFGADAVDAGIADVADVDTAMRLGVSYPRGPIEWGDVVGWSWVERVLTSLAAAEDAQRYRVPDGVRERVVHARG
jgi:3-hydroxybutyryl-CoA dehydrogenase